MFGSVTPRRRLAPVTPPVSEPKSLSKVAMAAAVAVEPAAEAPQRSDKLSVLARQIPLDMELPGDADSEHLSAAQQKKWRRLRLVAVRGSAVALVLAITLGGLLISQSYLQMHKVFKGTAGTAAALEEHVDPDQLRGEGRGRINILLLGRGGGNHSAPDLTDTIMVASVDPVNRTVSLLSVPRDLWVNVPDHGVMKLNAAWQSGEFRYLKKIAPGSTDSRAIQSGYRAIDETIKEVLDIEIDYHVLVNFQAFQQAVDTVGGVNMNVLEDLVDPTMAWENGNDPVLAKAGQQDFDGKKALMFARSRQTSSDFARGERQRALLLALKAKVATVGTLSNPVKMSGLLSTFGDNVQTDLSVGNATRLYGILKRVSDMNVASVSLADKDKPLVTIANVNGQSVVLPKSGLFKYADIQAFIRQQLQDPYIVKEKAKVVILDGTMLPGLASDKAEELKSYGYNVTAVNTLSDRTKTKTTLVDLTNKHKYTRNYLEKRFGQKAASKLPEEVMAANGADFAIIIGSNEASNPQH